MNKEALRERVLDVLRKTPHTHFRAVENEVRRLDAAYERRDVLLLNEVLWEMLVQGILAPGKNSLNPDLPFVHVTEYGATTLESGGIVAHDPGRYIERIELASRGQSDSIVQHARVAQQAFLDGRPSAALSLLSRAAETVLYDLANALLRRGRREGRGTKRLHDALQRPARLPSVVRRSLEGYRLPDTLHEEVERQLGPLIALADESRTRQGQPRVPLAERDDVLGRLLLLPSSCRLAYDIIAWLDCRSEGKTPEQSDVA